MKQATCVGCTVEFEYEGSYARKYCTKACMGEHYKTRLQGRSNPNFSHGQKACESCGKLLSRNAKRWCRPCRDKEQRGEANVFFGRTHTDVTRRQMRDNHGDNSHWVGRKHTAAAKSKMSLSQKARMARPEERAKATATLIAASQKQSNFHPTKPELAVESMLRLAGLSFERNRLMYDRFIVDFHLANGTVIEVFGDYWHANPAKFPEPNASQQAQAKKDQSRLAYLRTCGHQVLVIWENEILNSPSTVASLLGSLGASSPVQDHRPPSYP